MSMSIYYDPQATNRVILDLAKQRGLTDSELARLIEVTPQQVYKVRKNLGSFSLDVFGRICEVFGVTLDELIQYKKGDDLNECN